MRERERLWYVACTRARELLVVPELAQAEQKSWARVVNLGHDALLGAGRFPHDDGADADERRPAQYPDR